MNTINALFTWLAGWLLMPFEAAPLAGLLFWSAVAGVTMTCVFGKTSNQKAIRRVADRARAQVLGIRLFKDDLSVTLQCLVELLKASALRLLLSLPPMLVMILPLSFLLAQLAVRYEHRPLRNGEATVVSLQLSPDAWQQHRNVTLETAGGVLLETQSLRDESIFTIYWRIRPESDQPGILRWNFGDQTVEKELAVAADDSLLRIVSARRAGTGVFDRLLNPAEPGFSATMPVQSITVDYPRRQTPIFGLHVPWWATFFIASMFFALLVRRTLRVEF